MHINSLVPGIGAIFFGVLLTLAAYRVIGRSFTHQDYQTWLKNRGNLYRFLGPALIIIGIAILVFK